jgi:hypothetical protein
LLLINGIKEPLGPYTTLSECPYFPNLIVSKYPRFQPTEALSTIL